VTSCLLALLLFAPQHRPTPAVVSEQQKQVNALVAQILRLAASEPAVYGVDTRIGAAEVLTQKYPKISRELLEDARAELGGIPAPDDRDRMRIHLIQSFAPIDLEEAERLIQSFRRGTEHDYVAEAYDQLYRFFETHPDDALRMIHHGLQADGFRMTAASRQLETWAKSDPEAATALFAEILGAFPAEKPYSEDVQYLLEQTRQIAKLNRPLAVRAIDQALSAATAETLRTPPSEVSRGKIVETLLRQIASVLDNLDPGLLERYKDLHKELDLPSTPEAPAPKEEKKPEDNTNADLSALPYSDALARARKMEDPSERTGTLIEISRREELTPQQRTSIALEALTASTKMTSPGDQLFGFAMISRDFARRGELANAGLAAQMLSETFGKVCDCPEAHCVHQKENIDCLENVKAFAEYLDEFKISPESMNLQNISLESRLLVLKLHALLNPK
jgi:hypothetical protein